MANLLMNRTHYRGHYYLETANAVDFGSFPQICTYLALE